LGTSIAATAGVPEILLISDFPIDDSHLRSVRELFGVRTSDEEIALSPDGRLCRWPLRVAYPTCVVDSLSFHVFLCASFLTRRREAVERIRSLGCNLELCILVPGLTEYFSISASAMKQLADLQIQFSLIPMAAGARPPSAAGTCGDDRAWPAY
jgi:hypothetical protein